MKKYVLIGVIALFLLESTQKVFAQRETLADLLEKTIVLSENAKTNELKEALVSASFALENEAYTRGNEMKPQLLKQAKILKDFIPMASEGTLKTEALSSVVNTTRLLLGANRINNLLEDGKDGLLGNAKEITDSINLLQAGKSVLEDEKQQRLNDLLADVSKIVKQLDGKEGNAKNAASSAKKTLEKIVHLVKETI
ncbi:hypothetical protein [Emticicia sp. BO119]|uniref:hypothetical protein n=1 Tax=Emticicia sp. BO119 TaxID=2757768 RepID=UPI0015F0073F|nr:hypothetical protein [Emticicia sp. BO119]MBA4850545.1 hypothetical protein [Emticicia sp. BO119]